MDPRSRTTMNESNINFLSIFSSFCGYALGQSTGNDLAAKL
jgi:hypothetical protein